MSDSPAAQEKNEDWTIDYKSDDDVAVEPNVEEMDSESDIEEEDDGNNDLLLTKVSVVETKAPVKNKQLSKAEKAALKKKELEEMDSIFSEMGIDLATETDVTPAVAPIAATNDAETKDKKKRKKKSGAKSSAPKPAAVVEPATPLTEEQIKARLAAKLQAKKTDSRTEAEKVVSADQKGKKKKVYGNYDL